ncbi:MAG: 3-dehydroquinate synthase [Phycisphaerales bacterium]|nr:MAG: 3-dehydroquinate synthase [Phycisphaerales bacterium]
MGPMFDLQIPFEDQATRVAVRLDVLDRLGSLLTQLTGGPPRPDVLLVTDRHVGQLYGHSAAESLRQAGLKTLDFQIEPGEASKSLEVVGEVYRYLAGHSLARDTVIVSLGGGVVSDLAGFVAATWMRGIRFAVCPTTLEADVDASIGGKTAINVPGGKNLVGAFHQPILVAVDPACLKTLDTRDVRAGLAESVKHALVSSDEFVTWHEANADAILALDDPTTVELILENLRIKANIVQKDVHERAGLRMLLNFGHTIGHAIEECCRFALRHGECVSLGMVAACRLSHAMGLLDESVVRRAETTLARFGLPTELRDPIETDLIMATIRKDKKIRGGTEQFVLLEAIGRPVVRNDIPQQAVRDAYESLLP